MNRGVGEEERRPGRVEQDRTFATRGPCVQEYQKKGGEQRREKTAAGTSPEAVTRGEFARTIVADRRAGDWEGY